jgi:xylan 1,4-beta-xylosidase
MIVKDVIIDLKAERKPFGHFFRATGYANADYTYTPPLRRMYDCLESYDGHIAYIRLHNILTLHGKGDEYIVREGRDYGNPEWDKERVDVVVNEGPDGKLRFNWELVDRVYDIIINHGMRPIVETVYMPQAVSKSPEKFYLPKNFRLWEEVIDAFVRHWIERYGLDEVRQWYFEIWNEPDNHEEWHTNPTPFFALYDYFEYAIHRIDDKLKAGGPAVKQWDEGKRIFKAFLEHCDGGVNYKSGEYGSRLDFISVHCKGGYPTLVGPSMDYMFTPLREFIDTLKQFPKYAKTEFFNDESDIVWEGNMGIAYKSWLNFRNTHYAPGFTAKMIHHYCSVVEDELDINLAIVDSDNCHLPWEKSFFSGNRSQFTIPASSPSADLIRKPVFNIFPLLAKLGDERYVFKTEDGEFGQKYGVLATKAGDTGYAFMVWNFEDGLVEDVNARTIRLNIKNLEPGVLYDALHFRIDDSHSNAYAVWCGLDKPYPLTAEQISAIREHEGLELFEPPAAVRGSAELMVEFVLPMHGVSLYKLVKRGVAGTAASEDAVQKALELVPETGTAGNKQVFIRWNYSKRPDLAGYRIYRNNGTGEHVLINRSESTQCSYYVDMDIQGEGTYEYTVAAVYADGTESSRSPGGAVKI